MIPSNCPFCGSELTERMEEGRERLYCGSCERFIWRNPSPVAAVIIHDEEANVLLVKRGIEPGKGKWSLPAGFLELEESASEAAARELEEETGLEIEPAELEHVHDMNFERFPDQYLLANVYAVAASKTEGKLKAGSDADEVKYWDLEELKRAKGETLRSNFVPAVEKLGLLET